MDIDTPADMRRSMLQDQERKAKKIMAEFHENTAAERRRI